MSTLAISAHGQGQRESVRMHDLTPQAEKNIAQLAPPDRLKVLRILHHPVRQERCGKLSRLARYGLWHFDVTRSIRVTYRLLGGRACVLHVGTHAEFDHFVDHYSGNIPSHLIPMEESIVMKKHSTKDSVSTANGIAPSAPAVCLSVPSPARCSENGPDIPEVLRPLLHLFGQALAESCSQRVNTDIESMSDLVREELGTQIRQQADQLSRLAGAQDELAQQLALQRKALADTKDTLTKSFETALQHTADLSSTLNSARAQLETRLDDVDRRVDARLAQITAAGAATRAADRAEFSRGLEAVARRLDMLQDDTRSRTDALATRIDRIAEQQVQFASQLETLQDRQLMRIDEVNDRIEATVTALQAAVGALAAVQQELALLKAARVRRPWYCRIAGLAVGLKKVGAYLGSGQWIWAKR
jgi:hypothetical protein